MPTSTRFATSARIRNHSSRPAPTQIRLRFASAPGCKLPILRSARGGSGRLGAGAVLVPDDGYRLPLAELGAGGVRLVEPVCAQPLAGLGNQLGLALAQRRPHPQAGPLPQAFGRALQPRRLFRVVLRERQPGVRGQACGHAGRAAGGQAQVQGLVQERPGLGQVAPEDKQGAQPLP